MKLYHTSLRLSIVPVLVIGGLTLGIFSSCKRESTERETATTKKGFNDVVEAAVYPGGSSAWTTFLNKSLYYPQEAVDKEIQGLVLIDFVVDENGIVSDVKAVSGPAILAEEAVRLIKKSGRWVPGKVNGESVASHKKQSIVFRLEEG